jgi:hypothetical protein
MSTAVAMRGVRKRRSGARGDAMNVRNNKTMRGQHNER